MKTPRERFESKYTKAESGCWDWTAFANPAGYGRFRFDGKTVLAHRFAYELYVGPLPEGLWALHKCDNPKCVNPEHLFLGTNQDNITDKVSKNRQYSKLTDLQVAAIRELYATGNYYQEHLGAIFNTTQSQISYIVNRKSWKHLTPN